MLFQLSLCSNSWIFKSILDYFQVSAENLEKKVKLIGIFGHIGTFKNVCINEHFFINLMLSFDRNGVYELKFGLFEEKTKIFPEKLAENVNI